MRKVIFLIVIMICGAALITCKTSNEPENAAYIINFEPFEHSDVGKIKLCKVVDGKLTDIALLEQNSKVGESQLFVSANYIYICLSNYGISKIYVFDNSENKIIRIKKQGVMRYENICGMFKDHLVCSGFAYDTQEHPYPVLSAFSGGTEKRYEIKDGLRFIGLLGGSTLLFNREQESTSIYSFFAFPQNYFSILQGKQISKTSSEELFIPINGAMQHVAK